jgi:hypothetical protein
LFVCLLPVRFVLSGLTSNFSVSQVLFSSLPGSDHYACPDPEPAVLSVLTLSLPAVLSVLTLRLPAVLSLIDSALDY